MRASAAQADCGYGSSAGCAGQDNKSAEKPRTYTSWGVAVRGSLVTPHGVGLFAARAYKRGDILFKLPWEKFHRCIYKSVEALSNHLRGMVRKEAVKILEHSVPGVSGRVYEFTERSPIYYENHSPSPNVTGMHYSWLDNGAGTVLEKTALRDIEDGEEIFVDYDSCSGYDTRNDAAMVDFLNLCNEFGVDKRPSALRKPGDSSSGIAIKQIRGSPVPTSSGEKSGDEFEPIAEEAVKRCLLIRHSEDYDPKRTGPPAEAWQHDKYSYEGRDPVLTESGVTAAGDGFTVDEARRIMPGYKGVKGGIRGRVNLFAPDLVVSSPLRRALLTTCVACKNLPTEVPIVAHPDLREIKSAKKHAVHPGSVKPGCHGVPLQVLQHNLSTLSRGEDVDLSLLHVNEKGEWHPMNETPAESSARVDNFLAWLAKRPERRIIISTHGGVLKLPCLGGKRFLHGECRQYTFDGTCMHLDPEGVKVEAHTSDTESVLTGGRALSSIPHRELVKGGMFLLD